MDIYELDSYRLSDAVKFHTELNPALWDGDRMRPEVRDALLKIADDFKTFMGIDDLAIEDITVSGSNAAFSYTPHSDIDLHLLVDFSKLNPDDVYQELFNAKKYQYNDQHDIKIRGYDVELYVQDSNKPVRSLGEYSIINNDWNRIPVQRRGNLDEKSTQQKYEKLKKLIELALSTNDLDRVTHITDTLKKYRQAGLDKHGEFGPENLAYKILRKQGLIQKIFDHKAALEDTKLSLDERRKKKKKKKSFKYGAFGGYYYPGYHYYGQTDAAADGGGDGGGGESVKESTVNVEKKAIPLDKVVRRFVHFAARYLKLKQLPKIKLRKGELSHDIHSMGHYVDDHRTVEVETKDRHVMDILRTLAHELTHYRQHERLGKSMPDTAGRTGSPYENEANAEAGIIMRHFQNRYPEFFASTVSEDGDSVAAQYGDQTPPGPESPPKMPAGTVRVDVSDVYDWYKLGQHISNLKGLGKHDFGAGPPSSIVSFGSEEEEHKFIQDLKKTGLDVTDIDPKDPKQPAGMRKIKTDPTYDVDEAINTPVSKDEKANQDYYKFVRGKQQLGRPLTKAEMQFLSKYQIAQHLKKQVAEQDLEEDNLDEIDRRGFLKGVGAAAVGAAGNAVAAPFRHGEYSDQMSGEKQGKFAKVIADSRNAILEIEYDSKQPKVIIRVPGKVINFRRQTSNVRIKLGNGPVIGTYLNQGTSGSYDWGGILDKEIVSKILRHSGELKFEVDLYKEGPTVFKFTIEQDEITKKFAKSDDVRKEKEKQELVQQNLEKEKIEQERQRQEQEKQKTRQIEVEITSYKNKLASDIENKITSIIPTIKSRINDFSYFYRFMGAGVIGTTVEFDITKSGSIENFKVIKNSKPDYEKQGIGDILTNPKLYSILTPIPDSLSRDKVSVKVSFIPPRGGSLEQSPQAVVRFTNLQESKLTKDEDLEEGLGKALGTAAVAGAMALGSPAAKAQSPAYDLGRVIYNAPKTFTKAGAEEELKGIARDLARGNQEIRVGGKRIWGGPQAQGERVAANGIGRTREDAYQAALSAAYADANRRYGPISIGEWRPVEHEADDLGGQFRAVVVIQGPAPVREASGYIPTKKQAKDPRFKTALTVDIKPGQVGKEANKLGLKTDSQGRPDLLMKNLANALKEFKESGEFEPINEVRMNTGTLEAWARSPEAQGIRAGFEAELIFRDTKRDEDEGEMEPDYDYDERADDIDHVIDFFSNDDWGYGLSGRDARGLREDLFNEFVEWTDEQISESWDENAEDQIRDYMQTNVWDDDEEREKRIQDKIDELFPDDDSQAILQAGEAAPRFTRSSDQTAYAKENELYQKYQEASDAAHEDFEIEVISEVESQGEYYDNAREYYFEMMRDSGDYDERDFLRDRYGYMSDIANSNSLDWPYWTGGGSGGGSRDWEEIGDSLRQAVDMEVKVSGNYHSTTRKEGRWIIEPDGSLDPDDGDDMGLEIVSPPMPLLQTIDKLKDVIEWAQNEADAYTNSSTGLHMGISIPYVGGDVDYVKLVLFMGDEYILDKFGRASNTYAASAMGKLKQNIQGARNRGDLTEAKTDPMGALELVQKNLIELAARYVQQGVGTSKYTSAHIQDGYIEFRSPGGDYLSMESRGEWDDIKDTMLRFARAMYIASRPDLERKEYAKKLYKLISPGAQNDALKLFSEYSAGTIDKDQLKKQWADTVLQKEIPTTGKEEYEVYDMANRNSPDGIIDTFYARDYDTAYDQYTRKYNNDPRQLDVRLKQPWFDVMDSYGDIILTVRSSDIDQANRKVQAEYGDRLSDDWKVYRRPDNTPEPEKKLSARAQVAKRIKEPKVTPAVAADNAQDSKQLQARIGEPQPAGAVRDTGYYKVTWTERRGAGDFATDSLNVDAANADAAMDRVRSALQAQGREAIQIEANPQEPPAWRQPASTPQNIQGEFTGEWQVRDSDTNDVLYTFSGVGNNQGDANRVAARWLRQNAPEEADMTDVTVVPVMR